MSGLMGAMRFGCTQPEAFYLMEYRSADGSERETIWNSRDAVTPFIIHSRSGTELAHSNWRADRFAPDHVPKIGDRIFVNLTLEKAREQRRAWAAKAWDDPEWSPHLKERYPSAEAAAIKLAEHDYRAFGAGTTPDLVEVTEGVLADVLSVRRFQAIDNGHLAMVRDRIEELEQLKKNDEKRSRALLVQELQNLAEKLNHEGNTK